MKPVFKLFTIWSGQSDTVAIADRMPEQQICIDLNEVDTVLQCGEWRQEPFSDTGQVITYNVSTEFATATLGLPGTRVSTNASRPRSRDVYHIFPDRFILQTKRGSQHTVMGSFSELCDLLTNFQSSRETVE